MRVRLTTSHSNLSHYQKGNNLRTHRSSSNLHNGDCKHSLVYLTSRGNISYSCHQEEADWGGPNNSEMGTEHANLQCMQIRRLRKTENNDGCDTGGFDRNLHTFTLLDACIRLRVGLTTFLRCTINDVRLGLMHFAFTVISSSVKKPRTIPSRCATSKWIDIDGVGTLDVALLVAVEANTDGAITLALQAYCF